MGIELETLAPGDGMSLFLITVHYSFKIQWWKSFDILALYKSDYYYYYIIIMQMCGI